jgi:small subunit ribosomal protein S20e
MSQVAKDTAKDLSSVPATKNHKIRITLTSRNVKNLEKVCGDLVNRSKDKDLRVKGPVRLPTKRLHIVTRKTVRSPFSPVTLDLSTRSNVN